MQTLNPYKFEDLIRMDVLASNMLIDILVLFPDAGGLIAFSIHFYLLTQGHNKHP